MLRSPLAWTGGKSRLRGEIIQRIPPHTTYVELFAGAAWVLFGKDADSSEAEVLNDLDGELVNFWRVLKHRPAEFAERVSLALPSRELWNEWKPLRGEGSEIERAVRFYVVIKCGFGGQRAATAFAAHPARRPTMRWIDLREEFGAILGRLRQVWIEHLSWEECLAKYDAPRTFFYADPPYRCNGSKAYAHALDDSGHEALARTLLSAKGKWLLSYNDDPWLERLYSKRGICIERVSVPHSIARSGRRRVQELLIRNY